MKYDSKCTLWYFLPGEWHIPQPCPTILLLNSLSHSQWICGTRVHSACPTPWSPWYISFPKVRYVSCLLHPFFGWICLPGSLFHWIPYSLDQLYFGPLTPFTIIIYLSLKPFDDALVSWLKFGQFFTVPIFISCFKDFLVSPLWWVFAGIFGCIIFLRMTTDHQKAAILGFQKITCTQAATFSLTRAPVSLVVFQIPRLWRVSPENVGTWEKLWWPFFLKARMW